MREERDPDGRQTLRLQSIIGAVVIGALVVLTTFFFISTTYSAEAPHPAGPGDTVQVRYELSLPGGIVFENNLNLIRGHFVHYMLK